VLDFEWDLKKEKKNREKHDVGFSEASTVFVDPLELTIADPDHSLGEYRFISIGRTESGRLLVVSYTERHENRIRIISARRASKAEQKYYEQDR
jgi:hypothetical protein